MSKVQLFIGGPYDGERSPVAFDVNQVTACDDNGENPHTYYRKSMVSRGVEFEVFVADEHMRSYEVILKLISGYGRPINKSQEKK